VTAREAVAQAERRFAAAGIDTPRVDAEWLVAHLLGVGRAGILDGGEVDEGALDALVRRREAREPLAYVLGEWGFRRLTLKTDPRALVPRPETETLVDRALELIRPLAAPRVLDMGVGTGAIALALKDEHPGALVTGVDTSVDTVALARENAAALGLEVELREGGIATAAEGWDLVVANPPYVAQSALLSLQPELRWEPYQALVGNGFHAEIAGVADASAIAFEVGDGQAHAVAAVLADLGWDEITITRDLGGIERVVDGKRP
jgi:release factor glutamine methyltransferase